VGAWGVVVMSFFGAVFAALTIYWQWHVSSGTLALPFVVFAIVGLVAAHVIRLPGTGIIPTAKTQRALIWSSMAEGGGMFVASNLVINLHRPDLLLPAMALVVGMHFLPIALAASFRPFYILGVALILSAIIGFIVGAPTGGAIAGFMAGAGLWIAAILAVSRDWRAKHSVALNI